MTFRLHLKRHLESKTSAWNKGKGVSRKKNTAGLGQDDGELVEMGEKEKVLRGSG